MICNLANNSKRVLAFFMPRTFAEMLVPPPMAVIRRDAIYATERDLHSARLEQERINAHVALLAARLKRLKAEDRTAARTDVIQITGVPFTEAALIAALKNHERVDLKTLPA